ncbi:hypothetical protein [Krasilnikovia sp. MM14-A1259]|uniref:hypothetical protein n=1 Tax=Krasilnikovia sp. MM14-A1259 TaxID=3373539 RepID=UPI00399C634E
MSKVPRPGTSPEPSAPGSGPPAAAAVPVGRLWRRVLLRAALIPLIVLLPLTTLAPSGDHRFNIYWHGGMYRTHPFGIVTGTIDVLPTYLRLGNFRPLGRMVESAIDLAAYLLTDLLHLPANIALRLVTCAAAMLLSVTAVLFTECVVARGPVFAGTPTRVAAVLPFAVGGCCVAAGDTTVFVLFGALYLTTSALVLGLAAAFARLVRTQQNRLGWRRAAAATLAGAAIACFNELAALAIPLLTVTVLVCALGVQRLDRRRAFTGPAARAVAACWLGFLPIFLVVRVIIAGYCRTGDCYRGSDVALGPGALTAFGVRLGAWLPPLGWARVADGAGLIWGVLPLLALAALGVLAWQASRDLPRLDRPDRAQLLGAAAVAVTLLALGAGLACLNADVQRFAGLGRWGQGWRDSGVTAVAGGLLLALGAVALTARWRRPHRALTWLLVMFALAGTVTVAANRTYADRMATRPMSLLDNRIALEMAEFDRTGAGDARRCALLDEAFTLYADAEPTRTRYAESLDVGARDIAGVPFCRAAR